MLFKRTVVAPMVQFAGTLLLAATLLAAPVSAAELELRGAGSTFIAPLLTNGWITYFQNFDPDVGIHYDPAGSGEGVARYLSGSVDFAATDNFLPQADAKKIEGGAVQLPSAAGMIVLAYNLPGVKGRINLPQDVYTDIFLGKIRSWNDPRISAANRNLKLPPLDIAVVCRQESSGTTYAFTSHLAAASRSWAAGPGVGKIVEWPHSAMLARGNEGVASKIKISEGAIGYIEYGFALQLGLQMAALENKAGHFVAPTPRSGAAALTQASKISLDALDASTANPAGSNAYPIVTYSWILLYPSYGPEKARALASFLSFVYGDGQGYAPYYGYLPLPESVVDQAKAALSRFAASQTPALSKASVGLDALPPL